MIKETVKYVVNHNQGTLRIVRFDDLHGGPRFRIEKRTIPGRTIYLGKTKDGGYTTKNAAAKAAEKL